MMNQKEFNEYVNILLKDFDVVLFDEEGEAGNFKKGDEKKLTDYVFDVEMSAVVLYSKGGVRVGQLDLNMDRSEEKGVYVEISNHSDNPVTNEVASRADRYYPKH